VSGKRPIGGLVRRAKRGEVVPLRQPMLAGVEGGPSTVLPQLGDDAEQLPSYLRIVAPLSKDVGGGVQVLVEK
jgi:hypothetical protein